ncbi:MAG: hypothetical protein FD149_1039 [Rhodospirillaceae bacterium]|nr:MAG: hypothetical protein FD149_1039 [Rhodospirillaceae bacterium]
MPKPKDVIIAEIESYIVRFGGAFREWYVGFACDPEQALYVKHGLRKGDPGVLRTAHTDVQAADIVRYFVSRRRTMGEAQGTPENGKVHVYAYKLQDHTKP